ncbi:YesL family protein [Litchfieldia salsa]|uniref:Uncharacterized membrane protein YesL n=1 Tax=Litchfieldia salsa TaxID=930152 RepID=A0A1H0X2P5_9BACI|nr:YesL family protein [Litchfieldia salsa]SDP96995.1 Uncharacterized membrane protein YesL [Litchfieldia salsa]
MQNSGGLMNGFYTISLIISRLAYLNLLWMIFTIAGLVVFGLFPATAAMFSVTRKWVMKDTDIPIFKTFWQSYKSEFIKSNLLGLVLVLIGGILFFDLRFFQSANIGIWGILYMPLLAVTFIYALVLLYVFPIFVHFDITIRQILKNAFLMMVLNPLSTIMMILSFISIYFLIMNIPGLIPFFTGSVLAYAMMFFSYRAIEKVQQKKEQDAVEENH